MNSKLNSKIKYIIVVLLVIEIFIGIHINSLFKFMTLPTNGYYPSQEEFSSARFQRLFFIFLLVLLFFPLFYFSIIKSKLPSIIKNSILTIFTILCTFFITESVFMFYEKSDGIGYRLSHQLWSYHHYRNVYTPSFDKRNSPMQLRGTENYTWKNNGKPNIYIIGDSFGAGDGIEEDKTFPSLLSASLPQANIINICERGADTYREIENLQIFYEGTDSIVPKFLIWQYYANDIEETAKYHGLSFQCPPQSSFQGTIEKLFRNSSYFSDYLYWELGTKPCADEYMNFLEKAFKNEKVFNDHLNPLGNAIQWCKTNKIQLLVVIFPILGEIDTSEHLYGLKLTKMLRNEGVQVINMATYIKDIPLKNRIVNSSNPHPSEIIHSIATDKILHVNINKLN